jgi:hypothetical protein
MDELQKAIFTMNELKRTISLAEKLKSLNIKKEYTINEDAKFLLGITEDKITPPTLNKKIFQYAKENNLLYQNRIFRVNEEFAKVLGLTQEQIYKINSAININDDGCFSMFNSISFAMNCLVLD